MIMLNSTEIKNYIDIVLEKEEGYTNFSEDRVFLLRITFFVKYTFYSFIHFLYVSPAPTLTPGKWINLKK